MSFVRAGVGIAIVPSGAIAGLLGRDLSVLKLIRPRLSRDVGLIWLRERELTPAAKGFAVVFEEMWRRSDKLRRSPNHAKGPQTLGGDRRSARPSAKREFVHWGRQLRRKPFLRELKHQRQNKTRKSCNASSAIHYSAQTHLASTIIHSTPEAIMASVARPAAGLLLALVKEYAASRIHNKSGIIAVISFSLQLM